MDISDIDLYDDLDEFQEKEEKKSAELLALEAKYKESLETIELMNVEMKNLRKQQRIMEVNFQNLLDTAKTELKRKNNQIAQLQREKDDICFRRKKVTTGVVATATHKQFNDGAGSSGIFSHHQQVNPFKQNATKVMASLENETAPPKTDSVTSQIPSERLRATSIKRQLSPIDSDESWKETDNVEPIHKTQLHKKPRYNDEQKTQSRTHSGSDKDEGATPATKRERSHSRERKYISNKNARSSSRYKFNKCQRSSDTEDRYSDYQRERRRDRKSERDRDHHDRHRRNSREGRQRERHDNDHDRKHLRASRTDLESVEKAKYSKRVARGEESSSRSSSRKESLHKTLNACENSKESNKKSFNKKYEHHENECERKAHPKERTEVNKKALHFDQKDRKNPPNLEKYKSSKTEQEEKQPVHKALKRESKATIIKTYKHCISLDDAEDETELDALPSQSVDRISKQCKNDIDTNFVLDMDEISDNNLSDSSSDTIIFEITKDMSIKNHSDKMDNDIPKEKTDDALNTPKKVALFNSLFGQQAGDGTTTNKSSKLLDNVLEILKNDTSKAALNVDNKYKKSNVVLSPNLYKKDKDAPDITKKSTEPISSTKNIGVTKNNAKNINTDAIKNSTKEKIVKKNEIIEIEDDTDIYSTDEDIQFFKIEMEQKHSNITKPAAVNLESITPEDVSGAKMDKTKKTVIEIIEDIRLPTVLPIKQILRIHEETCAQQQQVITNKNTENLALHQEDGELQSKQNIEYSPNISAFNTDDELDISDQTEIIFDETNMSLEVVSDDQLSDLEDIKENNVKSLNVDNDAQASNNVEETNTFRTTESLTTTDTVTAQQQKIFNNETIELKNAKCAISNKELDSVIKTTEQDANAIGYLNIDENCAKQQEKEKHEEQKQEITWSTTEKTNETIDSNINTFDMQSQEEEQVNLIDKIVPVAVISDDIKVTLNNNNYLTDVQLLAEPSEQRKSKEKSDEIVFIANNDEQFKDIISDKQSNLSKFADTDQVEEIKIIVNDEQSSAINDHAQDVDKSTEHTSPNVVVNVIATDKTIDVVHENVIQNNIEDLSKTEKMELTTLTAIILNENDDIAKSIDKLENIVETEKRQTEIVEEFESKTHDEKDIKTTPDENVVATKDTTSVDTKEVICEKLRKEDVEANLNDICGNQEGNPDKKDANISIDHIDKNEEIKCVPETEVPSKNNTKKEEEKPSLETDEEKVICIEIKEIEADLEVGRIEIEAGIKELEVDVEICEKVNNETEETLKPEVLPSSNDEDDIIKSKTALNNNDELSERKTLIPGKHNITLNKELQNNLKEASKNEAHQPYSREFAQDDRKTKIIENEHKENKAYESFKKKVASNDRRGTSKNQSKTGTEEVNRSKTSEESLNQKTNVSGKITESPQVEVAPATKDHCAADKHQKELLLQLVKVPPNKQPNESKPKAKPEDDKTIQHSVQTQDNSDDNKQSAHGMDNKETKIETSSNKDCSMDTSNQGKYINNKSIEHEKKKPELNETKTTEDAPKSSDIRALKHTKVNELEQNTKTQEIAINQLRELSAIVGPDENYYISSEDEKPFTPKVLYRHPSNVTDKEKEPSKTAKSPSTTKNFFKILVAPKVEPQKRKLSDGYRIPKVKQPKLDIIDEPNDKEITKNAPKTAAAKYKDHKENFLNRKKEERKEEKILTTVKNSTKVNSTKTAAGSKKSASESIFSEKEAKINIPNNNQTPTSYMAQNKNSNNFESKAPVQTHKLELCDPKNPFYSTMDTIKVDKIKQKVNEKLLEAQLLSAVSENQAQPMSTADVNARYHSEQLKPTSSNIKSKVSPHNQRPAYKASHTTAKQTKYKHFRRIIDSSSGDEGSDEQNINRTDSRLNTEHLQTTAANLIIPNHELKRKKTKRRIVRVTTIDEAARTTPQHEIPPPPAPVRAPPTPILAPPTPDHAIFHTEPEPSCLYAESALPQFNHLQDKQYTDIDSRLQSMFQSPPYVADHQLTVVSNNLLSPVHHNASMSPPLERKLNDSSSSQSASNLESKRLSLGSSQYVVEKVSENVVNVFITRKRHKKKNTLPPTNNTTKPELLTSVVGDGIA